MHARVAPIGANSRSKFGPSSLSKFSADSRESARAMDPRGRSRFRFARDRIKLRRVHEHAACQALALRDLRCSCCFKEARGRECNKFLPAGSNLSEKRCSYYRSVSRTRRDRSRARAAIDTFFPRYVENARQRGKDTREKNNYLRRKR